MHILEFLVEGVPGDVFAITLLILEAAEEFHFFPVFDDPKLRMVGVEVSEEDQIRLN